MREISIFKICLEPIFNPICVDCLSSSVEKWLKIKIPNILKKFKEFDKKLKETFKSFQENQKCVKCGRKPKTIVCPYCYSKEVYEFLSVENEKIRENFIQEFNFDFLKIGYGQETILTRNVIPVMIVDKAEIFDMNICEDCGNQYEDLKEIEGKFVCEECEDESHG